MPAESPTAIVPKTAASPKISLSHLAAKQIHPAKTAMVEFRKLTMGFGERIILNKLDLSVPKGKVTVVMGGSGQGKSTILKVVMGFIRPSAGQLWIDGVDVLPFKTSQRLEVLKKLGMSFQYSALFDSMSVYDNCAFPLREHTNLSEEEIAEKVEHTLTRLSLPGIGGKYPSELSGGMKKRVGVARAIMLQPNIMLFDEPESGLDPITTTSIGELIMEMRDSFGITCLVISHHTQNSMMVADKVCMLYRGKIVAEGTPQQMKKHSDPIWQQFLHGRTEGPYQ